MEVQGQPLLHKDFEARPGYIRPRIKNQTIPNQNENSLAPREAEPLRQPGEPSASPCTKVQSEGLQKVPLAHCSTAAPHSHRKPGSSDTLSQPH